MAHLIERKTIASLLNNVQEGTRKYITPSYQRGYRWTIEQVDELLKDLLDYMFPKNNTSEDNPGFYCLQPVIVQRRGDKGYDLVDGQQRFTTLYILFKALCKLENFQNEDDFSNAYAGKKLMRISFETHPEDDEFLAAIETKSREDVCNINQEHMLAAYEECLTWIRDKAPSLCNIRAVRKIADAYLDILATEDDANQLKKRNVQVIWYELDDSPGINPIREFLQINSGKIPLTDSELVKALLLQKSNFPGGEAEQIQHALEWESMENALSCPGFWSMVSNDKDETDRMRIVLDMIYRKGNDGRAAEKKGDLFRFLANVLENGSAAALWNDVVEKFQLLETWFEDPLVHNYIGLLSHYGEPVYSIMQINDNLSIDSEYQDFIKGLVGAVQRHLRVVRVEDGNIMLSYDRSRAMIEKVLLFVNVMQMNHRIEERLENGDTQMDIEFFRFPFAIFDSQKWNVEHVDSFTANDMRDDIDCRAWIEEARNCFPELATDDYAQSLEQEGRNGDLIAYVQGRYDCGDEPEEVKNGIGNLTLLDESTNKGYRNHVFAVKSKIIGKKVRNGVFVPICTQWIFEKTLPGSNRADMLKWNSNDKKIHHDFVLNELQNFMAI